MVSRPAASTQFGNVEQSKVRDDNFGSLIAALKKHIFALKIPVNDVLRMKITHALLQPWHHDNVINTCHNADYLLSIESWSLYPDQGGIVLLLLLICPKEVYNKYKAKTV